MGRHESSNIGNKKSTMFCIKWVQPTPLKKAYFLIFETGMKLWVNKVLKSVISTKHERKLTECFYMEVIGLETEICNLTILLLSV